MYPKDSVPLGPQETTAITVSANREVTGTQSLARVKGSEDCVGCEESRESRYETGRAAFLLAEKHGEGNQCPEWEVTSALFTQGD